MGKKQISRRAGILALVCLTLTLTMGTHAAVVDPALIHTARTNGQIPVILQLRVPGIDYLTADCLRFPARVSDDGELQEAREADLRLEQAIHAVTDEVLFQLGSTEYRLNHTYSTLPLLALQASDRTLELIRSLPQVQAVKEDRLVRIPEFQVTPSAAEHPQMADAVTLLGADSAWATGYAGDGEFVAVLDSGIRRSHEAFTGKTIVEQCYSLKRDCPNGQTEMSGPGSARPYSSDYYGYDHGTHVSGIAAGNNGSSFFGIARDANIIHVQVFSRFNPQECGSQDPCVMSYNSDQLKGLEFVFSKRNQLRIAAVNMSLGGGSYKSAASCDNDNVLLKGAIDNLRGVGIPTIISSGNEALCDSISAPACISTSISVGATTKQDQEASFSNFHPELLDFFAPGRSIRSSTAGGDSTYESWSGTSMAAPMLTGAFAVFRQFSQDVPLADLLTALEYSARQVATKCMTGVEKPRIHVGDALMSLMTIAPPVNISASQERNLSMFHTEYINTLTWEANPLNAEKNVVKYRIYVVNNEDMTLLAEVDAATFSYRHRRVVKRGEITYAVTSMDGEGEESGPSYYTLEFGVEQ